MKLLKGTYWNDKISGESTSADIVEYEEGLALLLYTDTNHIDVDAKRLFTFLKEYFDGL